MKAIEIKIENPEFLRICQLAEEQNKSELEKLAKETKDFEIVEMVSLTEKIQIAVTPAFRLAYQGDDKAVNFLESNFALNTNNITVNICEGYALAGDLKNLKNYMNTKFRDPFFAIGKFLALGQHWKKVFTLYHNQTSQGYRFLGNQAYKEGIVAGLHQIIPVEYPQYLHRWLTKLPDVISMDPFLRELLAELNKKVYFNPLKLFDASQKIAHREGVLTEKAAAWSMLYVWLWQGPRSIKLPTVMFLSVASFLCPEDVPFLTKEMSLLRPQISFQTKISLFKSTLRPMHEWMAEEEPTETASSVVNPTIT